MRNPIINRIGSGPQSQTRRIERPLGPFGRLGFSGFTPLRVRLVASAAWLLCLALFCVSVSAVTPGRSDPRVGSADSAFIEGADISFLQEIENHGGVFKENGVPRNLLDILADHGFNFARLRVWHAPAGGYCGLDSTLLMAVRIKAHGLGLLIDLHYSDTWADPGKQYKPAAWQGLDFEALKDSVFAYTKLVVSRLRDQNTAPDMIQLGNEITCGMLWDDGRVCGAFDNADHWRNLAELLAEGVRGVRAAQGPGDSIRIMIHIDRGGDLEGSVSFFDHLIARGVDFDVIGLSYYPWWHGTLDEVRANLDRLARRYDKEIVVVETAYPWTLAWDDDVHNIVGLASQLLPGYPATVAGQEAFLRALMDVVAGTPGGRGRGIFYWEPDYISAPGLGSPWENLALFDFDGNLLPSVAAFNSAGAGTGPHDPPSQGPVNRESPDPVGPGPGGIGAAPQSGAVMGERGYPETGDTSSGRVTRANYDLAARFTANGLVSMVEDVTVRPVWCDGGDRFWYALRLGTVFKFFVVDVGERTRTETAVDVTPVGPTLMEFTIEGCRYRMDTVTREVTRIYPERPAYETWETPSPNGRLTAYARNHNLVVKTAGNPGGAKQVTRDSGPFYSFAEPTDPYYAARAAGSEDSLLAARVLWSPDSQKLIAVREDVRTYEDFWVLNSLGSPHPDLVTFKQRFPGDEPPGQEIWVYDAVRDSLLEVHADKWLPSIYEHLVWNRTSDRFYMVRKSPDWLEAELLEVDATTGAFRVLLSEAIGALVLTRPVVLLGEDEGFLWWSRRDGHGHYYRYDADGNLKGQVTSGAFTAGRIMGLDREAGTLYLAANGREKRRNPYYDYLYSVKIGSGDMRLLTYEDAHHEVYLAPSHAYFVDNFSRVDEPARALVRDIDGPLLMDLETMDISRLVDAGWKKPEVVTVKAADGKTDLWGVMWRPYDFDSHHIYPAIAFVYPGPQDELIPLTFMDALSNNAHLAQFGFIVIHAGNRGGSFKRSLEYSEYYRGNLRDYPVADNRAVVESLAERHDWIDIERIGIWGGSSGAFAALTGMLTYPGFYKVCVARSGPHDPSIYHAWWCDEFEGMTRLVADDGTVEWITDIAPGNLELAPNLKGRLLLVHSEMDENVHPAHSARMARALMAANKRFDYFVVPGAGHEWGPNWSYVQRMIWVYFINNLMGDTRWSVDMFEDFEPD
jgi:dipeptidyl-peptidase-4